jgi:DNA-binding PadR family transcriptional regulator
MKEPRQFFYPGWPPFGADPRGRTRFFGLGEARLAVLSLIADDPKHGYQLMKELAARLGSLYRASSGTVYPVLKQLENERLVEYRLEEGRKMYRLTREGRKLLSIERDAVVGIWGRAEEFEGFGQQMGPHSMTVAGPLTELYATALRAASWAGGDPNREDPIRAILRNASAAMNTLMAEKGVRKEGR